MNVECTYRDERQEVWRMGSRIISVVDLRLPMRFSRLPAVLMNTRFPFQAADVTTGEHEIGRFRSREGALMGAQGYVEEQVYISQRVED